MMSSCRRDLLLDRSRSHYFSVVPAQSYHEMTRSVKFTLLVYIDCYITVIPADVAAPSNFLYCV